VTGSASVGFLPSRHGLHFANRFPPGPTIRFGPIDPRWFGVGDASQGLCGGMVFTARDLWQANVEPPLDREPPRNRSARFRSIVRRQVESLDWMRVPLRFFNLSSFRPAPGRRRREDVTLDDEWPRVRAELEAGRPAMLGLIRQASANPFLLGLNHQVMAYAAAWDDRAIRIRIYDPNWPDRDDVMLQIDLRPDGRPASLAQCTGEPLLAFFRAPYSAAEPRAWRNR
jgi:hypothetical protein